MLPFARINALVKNNFPGIIPHTKVVFGWNMWVLLHKTAHLLNRTKSQFKNGVSPKVELEV